MLLGELASDVEQASTAFENRDGRPILLDMHDSRHTAVRINRRVLFGLGFASAHVQVDIVVWDAIMILEMHIGSMLASAKWTVTYESSSAAMVSLTGFTDAQP